MHRLTRHALLTSGVLICVLALTVSAVAARDVSTAAHPATLHFQTTRAASNNTTVTNVLTVSSSSISLGSTIQAQGKVTLGTQPLANARVALHLGDVVLATTQTDATGAYTFSVPVGVYYFPAAVSGGATVYSVATPPGDTSITAPSGVTNVAVDVLPLLVLIIIVVGAVLAGLYAYTRRLRRTATRPTGTKPVPPPQERTAPKTAAAPSELPTAAQPDELREHGIAVPMNRPSGPVAQEKPTEPTTTETPETAPTVSPEPEEHATAEKPPSDLAT
ncbi:MAG: hypothetical protein ACXV3D_09635, partial [Halobacteriota archaeon]